jgi:hypothetical protein
MMLLRATTRAKVATTPTGAEMAAARTSAESLADAKALYEDGQLDDSERAFSQLAGTSLRGEALYGLALVSLRRGDGDRARALFEQSLGADRKNPNCLYYLARDQLARGARDNAVALLGEALTYNPRHRGALDELGALVGAASIPDGGDSAWPYRSPAGDASAQVEVLPGDRVDAEAAPRPPRPPSRSSSAVGVVRNVSKVVGPWRGKPAAVQIWTFRLETYEDDGSPRDVIGVEMRGFAISGTLDNGDWVEIAERPSSDGYRPKEVRNLTTGDVVRAKKLPLFMAN